MHILVNTHGLTNPMSEKRMTFGKFKPGFIFDERKAIRRIAVHLIGAGKNERGIRAMETRCLQEIQGSVRIDRKNL